MGGINTRAAELQGADITLKGRWCVDDEGDVPPVDSTDPELAHHGTAVVSAIVGSGVAGDGGVGTRGVAPDAKILFYGAEVSRESDGWECSVPQPPEGVEVESDLLFPGWTLEELNESVAQRQVEGEPRKYSGTVDGGALAALDAIRSGADVISVSRSSSGETSWGAVMAEAIREGVVVVGATPNAGDAQRDREAEMLPGVDLSLPAALNGAVAVNAIDRDAQPSGGDDEVGMNNMAVGAPGVDLLVPGWSFYEPEISYGTSFATPLVAGVIALGLQKYPDATGHQVVQAMIHTPGAIGFAEPHWENSRIGYGLINPMAMLDVDITQMADEKPLFVTDPNDPRCTRSDGSQPPYVGACADWAQFPEPSDVWPDEYPTAEELLEPQQPEAEPEKPEEPADLGETDDVNTGATEPSSDGWSLGLILGLGLMGLLAVAAGIVLMVKKKQNI